MFFPLNHDVHGANPRDAAENRGDLVELDAVPAQLDLPVVPPEVEELTVMVPSDDVTGSVEALAPALRVGDETARGEARTPEVATSQTRAADVQLTGDARRHWPQESVEDAKAGSAEGPADRRWRPIGAEWARHGGNDRDRTTSLDGTPSRVSQWGIFSPFRPASRYPDYASQRRWFVTGDPKTKWYSGHPYRCTRFRPTREQGVTMSNSAQASAKEIGRASCRERV